MIVIPGTSLPALSNPGAAADLKNGKQLIDANGNVLTGTMPNITLPTPGITVSSGGLITASYEAAAGYSAGGSKSGTKQLTTQAGTTITPGTSQKTAVASGRYTTGNVYVAGDSDLKAENIKDGVNIFGVTGSLSPSLTMNFYDSSSDLGRVEVEVISGNRVSVAGLGNKWSIFIGVVIFGNTAESATTIIADKTTERVFFVLFGDIYESTYSSVFSGNFAAYSSDLVDAINNFDKWPSPAPDNLLEYGGGAWVFTTE